MHNNSTFLQYIYLSVSINSQETSHYSLPGGEGGWKILKGIYCYFKGDWRGDQSLPTEYKGVNRGGEEVEDFGGITWFSGGSGRVISHCQQSVKG